MISKSRAARLVLAGARFGLRHSRTRYAARMDILLLIALLVQLAFWWVGLYGEIQQLQRHFQANTVKKRNVLSTVRMSK